MIEWIVSSSVLILVVIGLRALFRGRISRRMIYGLWLLVLVRLLIPGSLAESAVSVANLARELTPEPVVVAPVLEYEDAMEQVLQQHSLPKENYEQLPVYTRSQYIQQAESLVEASRQEVQTQQTQAKRQTDVKKLLVAVWLIGVALTALAQLSANIRFARMLKRSREKLDYPAILPVYQTGLLQTPCLFGRTVYLPRDSKAGDIPYILAHELTHYGQGDHIWSVLRCVCLAVHWYNPLVWIAVKLSRNDSELACDEGTLERLGEESREAYGKLLIEMSRGKTSVEDLLLTATTMTGDKQTLYARVKAIAQKPRVLIWAVAITLAAAAVVVGCTFTGAQTPEDPTEPPETQETTEITIPVETHPNSLNLPVLMGFPWGNKNDIIGYSYIDYFIQERTFGTVVSFIRSDIFWENYAYAPIAVEDQLYLQRNGETLWAVGEGVYPGVSVLGTEGEWIYCLDSDELFRVDISGSKQTLFQDEAGNLPETAEDLYLTQDQNLLVFVAKADTGDVLYRLHLPSMTLERIEIDAQQINLIRVNSNYDILWEDENEQYHTSRVIPELTFPEKDPEVYPMGTVGEKTGGVLRSNAESLAGEEDSIVAVKHFGEQLLVVTNMTVQIRSPQDGSVWRKEFVNGFIQSNVAVNGNRFAYYSFGVGVEIRDSMLRSVKVIWIPQELCSSFVLISDDLTKAYHFEYDSQTIYTTDLETGETTKLCQVRQPIWDLSSLHMDSRVLSYWGRDESGDYYGYVSTETGASLGTGWSTSLVASENNKYVLRENINRSTRYYLVDGDGIRWELAPMDRPEYPYNNTKVLLEHDLLLQYHYVIADANYNMNLACMELYDLKTGRRIAQIEIPDGILFDQPRTIFTDPEGKYIWFTTRESYAGGKQLVCRWEYQKSPVSDETAYLIRK